MIRSALYGIPYSATGTIALGYFPVFALRSMIASSNNSGSMFHVSGSESTSTGVAPRYVTGCVEAQNVKLCTITSSPGFTPQFSNPRCTAAVPALSATTRFVGVLRSPLGGSGAMNSSRSFSNPFTFGPRGTTQFVSNASFTYFCSIPSSLM